MGRSGISVHSGRIERWLGTELVEGLSRKHRGFYGPPIPLLNVPGGVSITGDGDFIGRFDRGYAMSALDSMREALRRLQRARYPHAQFASGFATAQALIDAMNGGQTNVIPFNKGSISINGACSGDFWTSGGQPAAGSAGAAVPAGSQHVASDTGAIVATNPPAGMTQHLVSADTTLTLGTNIAQAVLLYDRLHSVSKTMNSTATEAVSGFPARYQGITQGAAASACGNFVVPFVGTVLPATAHNWTVCKYTNQAGTTGQTLPLVAGRSAAAANTSDIPTGTWFMPLAAGDSGIAALSQLQCSALVATGTVNFVIGHPLGLITNPVANMPFPSDWASSRNILPRIFDNACLALMQIMSLSATSTTLSGTITTAYN